MVSNVHTGGGGPYISPVGQDRGYLPLTRHHRSPGGR